jgi:hypothetical protein
VNSQKGDLNLYLARESRKAPPLTHGLSGYVMVPKTQPVNVTRLRDTASFTCPRCFATSYNPNDVRENYCGVCHDWTVPDADLAEDRAETLDSDVTMLDGLLRALGAKDGSCALAGLERLARLARKGLR